MNWINKEEKILLSEWASECTSKELKNSFMGEYGIDSYWNEFSNTDNIVDYDFSGIEEMKTYFATQLSPETSETLLLCVAAAFKHKRKLDEELEKGDFNKDTCLPEYVYAF